MASDSQNAAQKLGFVEKVGYSLGDSAANFVFQSAMMFLMFFYTDVFGIPAAVAGTLFLVARMFDAVTDPVMGAISDRTKTRWGKFRPWVLWTSLPFGIIFLLTYTTPEFSMGGKIIYAYITYFMLWLIYTANNIPYSALTGVLTGDTIERTSLTSYRFVLAMLATLAIQSFTVPMVNNLGEDNTSITHAELNNNILRIEQRGEGSSKIVVNALDEQGNEIRTDFIVKVLDTIPEFPVRDPGDFDLTLREGFQTREIDLPSLVKEGKYTPLSYSASSADSSIVRTRVQESTLTLMEAGTGVTEVVVNAKDQMGSSVRTTFQVAVQASDNTAPAVVDTPQVRLEKGFGIQRRALTNLFTDPDGDTLSYTISSSGKNVVDADIEGNQLALREIKPGLIHLTVTAYDGRGGMAELPMTVIVSAEKNLGPAQVQPFASATLSPGDEPIELDLAGYFDEPEGEELTYSVSVVDMQKGYQFTMGIFAALAVVFLVVTFLTTKERVAPDPKQETSLKQDLIDLKNNKPWIALFFLTIFIFVYLSLRGGISLYYFQYFVEREDLFSWFNGLGITATIIGIFFSKPLAQRFGKRDVFRVCLFITGAFTAAFIFLPPQAITLMFIFQIILQLAYGPTIPMLWAMMADVADYSEWQNGRRATGITFSAATFGLKFGLGIGGALVGWLLSLFGYVANVAQTETAMTGIRLMMSVFPAIPFFIGVGILFFYGLDQDMNLKIQDDLNERRKDFDYGEE